MIQWCHAYLCFVFEATANSTGECGPWFLDSPRHSVYTRCTNCSEAQFDSFRATCCVEPEKCNIQSSSAAYCFRFALPSQKKSCEEAGCTGKKKFFSCNTTKKFFEILIRLTQNFFFFFDDKKNSFLCSSFQPNKLFHGLQNMVFPWPVYR